MVHKGCYWEGRGREWRGVLVGEGGEECASGRGGVEGCASGNGEGVLVGGERV